MACWTPHRCPHTRRPGRERDAKTGALPFTARPVPAVRAVVGRFGAGLPAVLSRRGAARAMPWACRHLGRVPGVGVLARRRRVAGTASRFVDYGPDWPPRARRPRARQGLARRCVAVVVLYAVIWALGSVLLEVRLMALRGAAGGVPVTTYTTVTGPPRR
jgi:hypothetical protein